MTYYVAFRVDGTGTSHDYFNIDMFYTTGNGMTLKHIFHDVMKTLREYIRDGASWADAEVYNDDKGDRLCYVARNAGGDMETNRF